MDDGTREKEQNHGGDLMVAEEKETGIMAFRDFVNYFKFAYSKWLFPLLFIISVACVLVQLYSTFWVSQWTE